MNLDDIQSARKSLRINFIEHPRQTETIKLLETETTFSLNGRVFLLIGLPGFGVTTIAKALKSNINRETHPFNPFQALEIKAKAPPSGSFNWKTFFEEGLTLLNEPVVGQRLRAIDAPNGITKFAGNAMFRGVDKYLNDFSSALSRRMTRTIIVHNAHNMLLGVDEKLKGRAFAVMHQLADGPAQNPLNVVLCGTPALLKVLTDDPSQYLHLRKVVVPPYAQDEKDLSQYMTLLSGYEDLLKNVMEPRCLKDHAKDIYDRTLGGVGWIEAMLSDSLVQLELRPDAPLSWDDVKKHMPPMSVRDGLNKMLLEMGCPAINVSTKEEKPPSPIVRQNRSNKPFERGPGNDPVGRL